MRRLSMLSNVQLYGPFIALGRPLKLTFCGQKEYQSNWHTSFLGLPMISRGFTRRFAELRQLIFGAQYFALEEI